MVCMNIITNCENSCDRQHMTYTYPYMYMYTCDTHKNSYYNNVHTMK